MALTELLKSFARASVLGAALYACGGDDRRVGDYPGYEGMCEDFNNLLIEHGFPPAELERKDYLGYCLEHCSSPELIAQQESKTKRKCASRFCELQADYCREEGHLSRYVNCMQEQGYTISTCPVR